MITSPERLEDFNRWYASTEITRLSYPEALGIFAALWRHARSIREDFPGDWELDVKADVELARVLNGIG